MKSLYEGRKDLFEGLWINDHWNWEQQFPVIHVQFAKADYKGKGLDNAILDIINANAKKLEVKLEEESFKSRFDELIHKAAKQSSTGKVVLLIDEYDKPIIDYLNDIPQANQNRSILKSFYSILKDSDPYLELVFITGVSRFAKTSIFSDLNNITNLTIRRQAVQLLGITPEELESYFSEAIAGIAQEQNITKEELSEKIRHWYNGYSWDGKHKVYNPFSLLSFFLAREFDNFWFETGTPTFLVEAMRNEGVYNINETIVSEANLNSFDYENLSVYTVLFQTGYLTIKEQLDLGIYQLTYPNHEVKLSMEEYLLRAFSYDKQGLGRAYAYKIGVALKHGNIEEVISILNILFSSIPSEHWKEKSESFYHALIHLTFSLVGAYVQSELHSSRGRLDSIVHTADTIYVFEFKFNQSADKAIEQIQERGYFKPFLDSPKKRIGVGINFSPSQKEVESYKVQDF